MELEPLQGYLARVRSDQRKQWLWALPSLGPTEGPSSRVWKRAGLQCRFAVRASTAFQQQHPQPAEDQGVQGGEGILEEGAFDLGLQSSRMEGDKMSRGEEGMAPARVWR